MRRDRGGQGELKSCAARGVVGSPQASAVRLNDGLADAKPHAGPVNLGGKKCIEYPFRLLRRKPNAGISDGYKKLLVLRQLRLDGKVTRSVYILHGIDTVDDQVDADLLQLHAISDDLRKIGGQLRPDGYVVAHCLAAKQGNRLLDDFVYIKAIPVSSRPSRTATGSAG